MGFFFFYFCICIKMISEILCLWKKRIEKGLKISYLFFSIGINSSISAHRYCWCGNLAEAFAVWLLYYRCISNPAHR